MIRVEAGGMITRVLRNGLWLGAGEAAVKGGLLAVAVLIARGSGPAAVGTFSIAFGAALVGIMLLACGQQEVLIREVARAPDRIRPLLDRSRAVQRRLAMWMLPAATVSAVLVSDRSLRLTLVAFIPYIALRTAVVTRGAAFKGLDRMDVEVRARGLEVTTAVLGVGLGAVLKWPLWTTGIAFSLGAALGLAWISRRVGALEAGRPGGRDVSMVREGLPFMMLAVLGQLLVNTDRFLLALLGVARSEIGYWGAAATVVWALVAAPQLAAVAAYPTFSRLAVRGETWRRAGFVAAGAGLIAGVACTIAVRAVAAPLVEILFGSGFESAVELMRRLALALPGAFVAMAAGSVYAAWRRQKNSMWVSAGTFGLSLALNLMWIPFAGATGCANAAVASFTAAGLFLTAGFAVPAVARDDS